ncbi:tRNA threonylcarbamoyladenosine biosynthesis protein TsaE [Mycobacterium mantenii]|uniref:tRNA threonylcarbamoyladenosine biosynthesis protein TsaE n=2 Tax=Mycobacterium mantenii TaxID=560555 RepID=A0ABM7JTN6_MYCNT|nr:tRNA (adenosine(37)-N6)-threonylcarbamoyltransferase complex ATPase subunit type 1 TsaE [Mycobacterium mantenii]BBY38939.1 tRNA threonylcarbamoyladenosine biosynthesis protein TsaE [Mycobacterium mantenii]
MVDGVDPPRPASPRLRSPQVDGVDPPRPASPRSRSPQVDGVDPPRPASPRAERDGGTATLERVEDTMALGSRLGQRLRAGDVVVLSGPLGAGKTVLAKGIAAAMDVDGPVTSPSYVLARVHPPRRPGTPAMIHVDMYRLLDHTDNQGADLLGELDSLDLDSDLDDAVVVVEWGEGLVERLAERHLDIRLERLSESDVRIASWQWIRA